MNNLGEKIKAKRLEKGLTIEDLSKQTLLSIAIIKDIEDGAFDRYEGDEVYVKKYLSKISSALDLDSNEVTKSYIELTREIHQEEIERELKANQAEDEKRRESKKTEKPKHFTSNKVYQDRSHLKIIRLVIVFVLIALVIATLYFAITTFKKKDTNYVTSNDKVTGEVSKKETQTQNAQKNDTQNEEKKEEEITYTRTSAYTYQLKIPTSMKEFTFKAEFSNRTYSLFTVNGINVSDVENRIYTSGEKFETKIDVSTFQRLRLHLANNQGTKYYINDKEITLTSQDKQLSGITNLVLVKAN